jgi:predicted Zn-dependent protease
MPLLAFALVWSACSTVPVTGRHQLSLLSQEQENQLGAQAYDEMLSKEKVITSGKDYEMVAVVAKKLIAASKPEDPGFDWQYRLIDNPKVVNAACLPGGKIVVYTGILPVTQNEAGLAVVLGHEISHALAHHGNERVSQSQFAEVLLSGAGAAAGLSGLSDSAQQGIMAALGAGAQYGVLMPFSRKQESEADHIGLILMARAGYDPHEAIKFWQRMEQMAGSGQPPEFLSTHPSHETRVKDIESWIPEALKAQQQQPQAQAKKT